jgi:hypothetical protein
MQQDLHRALQQGCLNRTNAKSAQSEALRRLDVHSWTIPTLKLDINLCPGKLQFSILKYIVYIYK